MAYTGLQADYISGLERFLRIPSISSDPERVADVRRAAEFVRDELHDAGLANATLIEGPGHPLVYADWLNAPGKPTILFYMPFVLIAIAWAVSIHTVTAFLYVGLVGRPFWNSAIVAPRFLGSAFTAGPGILILVFQVIRRMSNYQISDRALHILRNIVTVSLLVNLFLLGCEAFKEFYSESVHSSSAKYLFFGLHGHDALVPWMWGAMAMECVAAIVLIIPPLAQRIWLLNTACVLAIIGICIEKGMRGHLVVRVIDFLVDATYCHSHHVRRIPPSAERGVTPWRARVYRIKKNTAGPRCREGGVTCGYIGRW